MTRTAISPRLAIRIFFSTAANVGAVEDRAPQRTCGPRGRQAGPSSRWPRRAARTPTCSPTPPAGRIAACSFADHQTAGEGRLDRRWEAPPGANLLVSILFHEVPAHPSELTRRIALAAVDRLPGAGRCRRRAEVAERPARRRAQAGRHPRRARRPPEPSSSGSASTSAGLPTGGRVGSGDDVTPRDVLSALLAAYDAPAVGHRRRLPRRARDARAARAHRAARAGCSRARPPTSSPTAASSSSTRVR